jgi:hypothetical protein
MGHFCLIFPAPQPGTGDVRPDLAWYFPRIMIFFAGFKIPVAFAGTYEHSLAAGEVVEDMMSEESPGQRSAYFPAKSYLLNSANCFIWFSPEWNVEFQDTLQESYDVNVYLGRCFLDLLSGPSIRMIYQSLFQLIRDSEPRPLSLTMRCDKPPLKIRMSQELRGRENGFIKVEISYISVEAMPDDGQFFRIEWNEPLKMCSWCQSIYSSEEAVWLPLERALGHIPILHEPELPAITHGCCPACYQTLRGKINEYSCGR